MVHLYFENLPFWVLPWPIDSPFIDFFPFISPSFLFSFFSFIVYSNFFHSFFLTFLSSRLFWTFFLASSFFHNSSDVYFGVSPFFLFLKAEKIHRRLHISTPWTYEGESGFYTSSSLLSSVDAPTQRICSTNHILASLLSWTTPKWTWRMLSRKSVSLNHL